MVYPPTIPPNTRTNATVTEDNHPDDHNDAADALTAIVTELGSNPSGGDADLTTRLTALDSTVAAKVAKSLYDANTILKADSDDTPVALTVGEQTLVGRITAGTITALTPSQGRTLLDVPTNSESILKTIIDAKGDLIVGTAADTPARLAVGTNGEVLLAASGETPGVDWTTTFTAAMTFNSVTTFAAGTAAAPSLTFTGDTNTGIYSDTADTIRFSTAGTLRMSIGATGIIGQVFTSDLATGTSAAGSGALGDNTTAVGYQAGKDAPNTADQLTAVGYAAGSGLTRPGTHLTIIGASAGTSATGHTQSTLVGALAGYSSTPEFSSTPYDMTAFGYSAGASCTSRSNAFFGYQAGAGATGYGILAMGTNAALQCSGDESIAMGIQACYLNTGAAVIGVGPYSFRNNTGTHSVGLGYQAGDGNTGSSIVAIGIQAGLNNTYASTIMLGRGAVAAAANEMVIGSASYAANRWIPGHDPDTYLDWATADTIKFYAGAQKVLELNETGSAPYMGFFGTAAGAKPTVTGSRGGNAALADLLTELATLGLITDSSSA